MPTATPNPSEVLTVTLTAEQVEHVRDKLLSDFASGHEQFSHPDRQSLEDAGRHADTYRAKLEDLEGSSPFTYADRRCELVQTANDLLEIGAGRARDNVPEIGEAGGDEAVVRERLRQMAPAFTAQAILAQLGEKDG